MGHRILKSLSLRKNVESNFVPYQAHNKARQWESEAGASAEALGVKRRGASRA